MTMTTSPPGSDNLVYVDSIMMYHALLNHDFTCMSKDGKSYYLVEGFLPDYKPMTEHKIELLAFIANRMTAMVEEMNQLAGLIETQLPEVI